MLGDVTSKLQEKLAERWANALFGPALVFWLFGLASWTFRYGSASLQREYTQFTRLPPSTQIALTLLALFGLVASSVLVERLDFLVLRAMEGYWLPIFQPFSMIPRAVQEERWQRADDERDRLDRIEEDKRTPEENLRLVSLDAIRHRMPDDKSILMPTTLGNILLASEQRPRLKYGLDVNVCWPRLWLLLPNETRNTLATAREALDTSSRWFLWSLLLAVWYPWAGWAAPLAALLCAFVTYRWAVSLAATYGDLLESAFDLYRLRLYKAVLWPTPTSPDTEKESGESLTTYLFIGIINREEPQASAPAPQASAEVTT